MERQVNIEKIKKLSSLIMTAVFVLTLLGAMLTFVFADKEDVSYYENRTLAKLKGTVFNPIGSKTVGNIYCNAQIKIIHR